MVRALRSHWRHTRKSRWRLRSGAAALHPPSAEEMEAAARRRPREPERQEQERERERDDGGRVMSPSLSGQSYWLDLWLFILFDLALFLLIYLLP